MTQQLIKAMNDIVLKEGMSGRLRLALAIGRSERMIRRYCNGLSTLSPEHAYALAIECGFNEKDAKRVASELVEVRA